MYESLRSRRIRYIEPPASFERTGQKVRTTAQVLEDRFGTCIDLAVAYAACLEAAGLHPLVWLVKGHAFAGFLRDDDAKVVRATLTEQNALVNLVESGIAVPVEAIYYRDTADGSFTAAVAAGGRHFAQPENLCGVVSISGARRDGLTPLPSSDEVVSERSDEPIRWPTACWNSRAPQGAGYRCRTVPTPPTMLLPGSASGSGRCSI